MSRILAPFFTAIRFLTIIPLSLYGEKDGELHKESSLYFIPVGVCIGSIGVILTFFFRPYLPHEILCSFIIIYLSGISGFLHLDGLADSADGLLSHRSREKKLSIMRDSRTGAMGVIVLLFILLFKYAAFTSLASENLLYVVFLLPVAGRCSIVISMCTLGYARAEGGLGELFYIERRKAALIMAVITFFICSFIVGFLASCTVLLATAITTSIFCFWCKRSLGGATGDTLGAVCELTETTTALFLAILFH